MIDLTKIDTIFRELDDATKGALLLAEHEGKVIEFRCVNQEWVISKSPGWGSHGKYRVRPAPAVMGSVTMHGFLETFFPIEVDEKDGIGPHVSRLTFTFPTRDGQHVPGVYTSPDGLQIVIEVAE